LLEKRSKKCLTQSYGLEHEASPRTFRKGPSPKGLQKRRSRQPVVRLAVQPVRFEGPMENQRSVTWRQLRDQTSNGAQRCRFFLYCNSDHDSKNSDVHFKESRFGEYSMKRSGRRFTTIFSSLKADHPSLDVGLSLQAV